MSAFARTEQQLSDFPLCDSAPYFPRAQPNEWRGVLLVCSNMFLFLYVVPAREAPRGRWLLVPHLAASPPYVATNLRRRFDN